MLKGTFLYFRIAQGVHFECLFFLFMSTFSFTISFLNMVWRPRNSSVGFFNILHWNIGNRFFDLLSILWQNSISVQLNEYETDLFYFKLSQHITTDCLLIYGFFTHFYPFLPVLVCCDLKIVLHWYENENKNNFAIMCCKSSYLNTGKLSEILKPYHGLYIYRNYNSV